MSFSGMWLWTRRVTVIKSLQTMSADCILLLSHSLVFLKPKHSHFQAWLNKRMRNCLCVVLNRGFKKQKHSHFVVKMQVLILSLGCFYYQITIWLLCFVEIPNTILFGLKLRKTGGTLQKPDPNNKQDGD